MDNRNHIEDITVFVITTGEDMLGECLDSLRNQDCTFNIEYIRDVYPMSQAFQEMPDRCKTRYFIQQDADFILKPHAIRTLYEAICESDFRTYRVVGPMYEEGFGAGGGAKCWKRNLFRIFKFRDSRTVDRDLHRRVKRWGMKSHRLEGFFGTHKPRHSIFYSYLKTKSDIEKWRFLKRPSEQYALGVFDEIVSQYPESQHLLLGATLGTLTGKDRLTRSKNTKIERDRYNKILHLLQKETKLSPAASLKYVDRLKNLFSKCYADEKISNVNHRIELAHEIYGIYSNQNANPNVIRTFLETVEC